MECQLGCKSAGDVSVSLEGRSDGSLWRRGLGSERRNSQQEVESDEGSTSSGAGPGSRPISHDMAWHGIGTRWDGLG